MRSARSIISQDMKDEGDCYEICIQLMYQGMSFNYLGNMLVKISNNYNIIKSLKSKLEMDF
jgi:hypothetical protein